MFISFNGSFSPVIYQLENGKLKQIISLSIRWIVRYNLQWERFGNNYNYSKTKINYYAQVI